MKMQKVNPKIQFLNLWHKFRLDLNCQSKSVIKAKLEDLSTTNSLIFTRSWLPKTTKWTAKTVISNALISGNFCCMAKMYILRTPSLLPSRPPKMHHARQTTGSASNNFIFKIRLWRMRKYHNYQISNSSR